MKKLELTNKEKLVMYGIVNSPQSTDKQLSLFILGDDFSRGSIQSLIDTVDRLNHSNSSGTKRVRINAVGFPVLFGHPGSEMNIARFSALMRKLAENNNGSFVGLTDTK